MARPRGNARDRREAQAEANGEARKLIGYIRVSTEGQGSNGLGMEGQRDRVADCCRREGYELVEIVEDVASGGKTNRRGLAEVQRRVERGEAEGIVFAKWDRITRSLVHGGQLVEWAQKRGGTLLASDEGYHVRRGQLANEALPFLIAMAQVERERMSRRMKEVHRVWKRSGVKVGGLQKNVPHLTVEDAAGRQMVELREAGVTFAGIAETLEREGLPTVKGGKWRPATVYVALKRLRPDLVPEGKTPGRECGSGRRRKEVRV